jgi:hypothetical protein
MNPERYKKVDQVLQQALGLSPEQRNSFLQEACAGDEDLRREVESLIAHERQAASWPDSCSRESGHNSTSGQVRSWRAAPSWEIGDGNQEQPSMRPGAHPVTHENGVEELILGTVYSITFFAAKARTSRWAPWPVLTAL